MRFISRTMVHRHTDVLKRYINQNTICISGQMVTMIDWISIIIGAVIGGIITYAVEKYFNKKQKKDIEGLGKKVDKGTKKVEKKIDSLIINNEDTDTCEECGAIISVDDLFCPNCGVEFEEDEDV